MYLDSADKTKIWNILTTLQTQQSLKNNQYPKTNTEANIVLSGHWLDNAGRKAYEKTKENEAKDEEYPKIVFAMMEGKNDTVVVKQVINLQLVDKKIKLQKKSGQKIKQKPKKKTSQKQKAEFRR